MTKLLDLKASGNLKALWDLRKGSLLDVSGNGNTLTVTGTPTWARTRKGFGVYFPQAGLNELTPGNPASLQLTGQATIFAACLQTDSDNGNYRAFFGKKRWGHLDVRVAGVNKFYIYTGTGAAAPSTYVTVPTQFNLYSYSFVDGVSGSTYVNGIFTGAAVNTILNQTVRWTIGGDSDAGEGLGGVVLFAGIVNRVLRPDEHMDLALDFARDGYILDLGSTRNGVKFFIPAKTDADYVREGIVLDTDFVRQSDGKVRDLSPSGYAGTLTGVPVPGPGGEGMKSVGLLDEANFGDVTQLNSASTFTLEFDITPGTMISEYLFGKISGAATRIAAYTGAGASAVLNVELSNGLASIYPTTVSVLRAGCRQHVMIAYNGLGATDAAKLQVDVDGDPKALTYTNPVVAATPNLAGSPLYIPYNGHATPGLYSRARLFTGAINAAQRHETYVKNFAQKLIWQAPGEDCPVSLVASYGVATPNALGGGWTIISGTWKNSEDSQGRRWAEAVTYGAIARPKPNAFGTLTFTIWRAPALPGNFVVSFIEANPVEWNAATSTGYMFFFATAGGLFIERVNGGAITSDLARSANGYLSASTAYQIAINRRPSDGRFTTYLKGGIYKDWTLASASTAGSNPTAADATYTTSGWITVSAFPGDKILIHDPTIPGNPCPTRIYQGVLNPLLGEIPQ